MRLIPEECLAFLDRRLKLMLNMGKAHATHVNDGFIFLGAPHPRVSEDLGVRGQVYCPVGSIVSTCESL